MGGLVNRKIPVE